MCTFNLHCETPSAKFAGGVQQQQRGRRRDGGGNKSALKLSSLHLIVGRCISKPMSAECSVQGCTKWVFEKGLCRGHILALQGAAAAALPPPLPSPIVSVHQNPPVDEAAVFRCVRRCAPPHQLRHSIQPFFRMFWRAHIDAALAQQLHPRVVWRR